MKLFITIILICVASSLFGQWQGTNPVYFNAGSVGIGTNSPQFNLEVVGFGQGVRNPSSAGYSTFRLYNDQNSPYRALEIDYAGSAYPSSIVNGSSTGEGASIATTGAFPLSLGTSNTSRITILGNGNVGIGTNSPGLTGHVLGTLGFPASSGSNQTGVLRLQGAGSNGVLDFSVNAGSGASLQVTNQTDLSQKYPLLLNPNGGNVGIGITAPIFKVHAISSVQGVALFNTTSTGNTGNISILNGSSWAYSVMGVVSGNPLVANSDVYALGYTPNSNSTFTNVLNWTSSGLVGIGTSSPDAKLAVSGQVHAQEVKVSITVPGPDYVFEKDYKLSSLDDIKTYIDQNKHLPEVPSAKEMEKNGVQLGEMNMLLLKKIEELTLYVIEQNKKMEGLKNDNETAKAQMKLMQSEINQLKK